MDNMDKVLVVVNIIIGLITWAAVLFFHRKCPSWFGPTRCKMKRGHLGNHRGHHWSGRTLYWRELDTNHLQDLMNAIRKFDQLRMEPDLQASAEAWTTVLGLAGEVQSSINGSRTVGAH